MFIIVFYDINANRVNKMLKLCRKYLVWIQNSVLEGEITEANLKILTKEMNKIIKKEDGDSVVIYKFRTLKYIDKMILGENKKEDITII